MIHLQPNLGTPDILISYDAENDWLYVNWQGMHTQASVQHGCQLMQDALRQYPTRRILNDNSNLVRLNLQLTEWGVQWLRGMYEVGLRYMAWVYAPDFPGRKPSDSIIQYLDKPTVLAFDDVATACLWLSRQQGH